jgi:hypothetical protein
VSSIAGGGGGGSGTVTSVEAGVGLTASPSPITTTGTISADTSVLASKTYVTTRGYTTGSGTTGTIPAWSSSTALGDSPLTVSSGNVTATGTGSFRLPNGTTAQRPGTPSAGMTRYNTSNGNLDFYGASAWENPLLSYTATGLGTTGRVFFAGAGGRAAAYDVLYWDATNDYLGIGVSPTASIHVKKDQNNATSLILENASNTVNARTAIVFRNSVVQGYCQVFPENYTNSAFGGSYAAGGMLVGRFGTTSNDSKPLFIVNNQNGYVESDTINNRIEFSIAAGVGLSTATRRGYIAPYKNYYKYKVGIGTETPRDTLEVNGTLRVNTLSATAGSIAGFTGTSGTGVLTRISLGSGLSLSSGTLSATGGLSDPGSNGILARTSSGTTTARTITAGSGIAISNGDGVSGNPTISRTYSLIHTTITGGSTFFGTTAERPDNDIPGNATTSAVGSDFSVSGSTINYTGATGALLRVEGSISFSVADDGDYYLSLYKEGTELGATSMRVSCVAGNYYSISLPATTTSVSTNDTFDLRIATVSGNSTTTMHRYGFIIERIY